MKYILTDRINYLTFKDRETFRSTQVIRDPYYALHRSQTHNLDTTYTINSFAKNS
jgi:hypothetical protein